MIGQMLSIVAGFLEAEAVDHRGLEVFPLITPLVVSAPRFPGDKGMPRHQHNGRAESNTFEQAGEKDGTINAISLPVFQALAR